MRKVDTIKKSGSFRETVRHNVGGRYTRMDAAIEPTFFTKGRRCRGDFAEKVKIAGMGESTEARKIATAAFEAALAVARQILVVGMSEWESGHKSSIGSFRDVTPHSPVHLQYGLPLDASKDLGLTLEEAVPAQVPPMSDHYQALRTSMPLLADVEVTYAGEKYTIKAGGPPAPEHPFIAALDKPPRAGEKLRELLHMSDEL